MTIQDDRAVLAVDVERLLANDAGHAGPPRVIDNARFGSAALSEDGAEVLYAFDPAEFDGKDAFSYRLTGADGSRALARTYFSIDMERGEPAAPEGRAAWAVNLGSDRAHVAADGTVFAADDTGVGRRSWKTHEIEGTEDDALYQSYAWSRDALRYRLKVEDGDYAVRLHFAENHAPNFRPGGLTFDVRLEGRVPEALDDLDVFARAGARTAYVHQEIVTVEDGRLDVEARKMAAIEVIPMDEAGLLA